MSAVRNQLAEELAAAPPGSRERRAACGAIVDHILTEGPYEEEFSTPSGRTFAVHLSRPKSIPADVRAWLAGRDFVKVVKGLLRRGSPIPAEVIDLVRLTVAEKS